MFVPLLRVRKTQEQQHKENSSLPFTRRYFVVFRAPSERFGVHVTGCTVSVVTAVMAMLCPIVQSEP